MKFLRVFNSITAALLSCTISSQSFCMEAPHTTSSSLIVGEKLFNGEVHKVETFVSLFTTDKKAAVLNWFTSLDVAKGLSPHGITLDAYFGGNRNDGIFFVKIDSISRFVIKITTENETPKLLVLSNSELFTETNPDFPHIVKLLNAAKLPDAIDSPGKYLQLFPFEQGCLLRDLVYQPIAKTAFYVLGQKLAPFNTAGWFHNDLHQGHVIYDETSKQVSLIDNANLLHTLPEKSDEDDLLPQPFINKDVLHVAERPFTDALSQCANLTAGNLYIANVHLSNFVDFAKGYYSALSDKNDKRFFDFHIRTLAKGWTRNLGEHAQHFPLLSLCSTGAIFAESSNLSI